MIFICIYYKCIHSQLNDDDVQAAQFRKKKKKEATTPTSLSRPLPSRSSPLLLPLSSFVRLYGRFIFDTMNEATTCATISRSSTRFAGCRLQSVYVLVAMCVCIKTELTQTIVAEKKTKKIPSYNDIRWCRCNFGFYIVAHAALNQ